jgi:hypothetical protein
VLLDGEQDRGLVFNGAAEAEPGGERDAAGGLGRQVGEVEDDQAEASAFEQKVGGAEDLLEAMFGLARVAQRFFRGRVSLAAGTRVFDFALPKIQG